MANYILMDPRKSAAQNSWEDDWSPKPPSSTTPASSSIDPKPAKLSQKERLRKHREDNKKLWASADDESGTQAFHYTEMQHSLPPHATPNFRGAPKVLSRRPDAQRITPRAQRTAAARAAAAVAQLSGIPAPIPAPNDEDEEDEDDPPELTVEQRRALAEKDLEAKQARYRAARERILGPGPGPGTSSSSSPARQPRPGPGGPVPTGNGPSNGRRRTPAADNRPEDLSDFVRALPPPADGQRAAGPATMNPLAAEFRIVNEGERRRRGRGAPGDGRGKGEVHPVRQPRGPDAGGGRGFAGGAVGI